MKFNVRDLYRSVERIVGDGIINAEEADVTVGKITEIVWPVIQYHKDRMNQPGMKKDGPLCAEEIKLIVNATDRFDFLRMSDHYLVFWDTSFEEEMHIPPFITLCELMRRIINFHEKESLWKGEEKARRQMRHTLGLD